LDANKIEALKKLLEKDGIVFRKLTLSSGKKWVLLWFKENVFGS